MDRALHLRRDIWVRTIETSKDLIGSDQKAVDSKLTDVQLHSSKLLCRIKPNQEMFLSENCNP